MFGGSHFSTSLLYKIQESLPKIKEDFIVFSYKLHGESYDNVTFMNFRDNFLDYLKASKGIITQAGFQTFSESVILKKPILMFPIPNFLEQEIISSWAEKKGIAIRESHKYLSEKDLLKILKNFTESLPKMQRKLNKINIKSNGAQEAADIIESLVTKEKSK